MTFALIHARKAIFPIATMCRVLEVSCSGFYAWAQRRDSAHAQQDRRLRVLIRASFEESKHRNGSPRIYRDLVEQAIRVSRKRVIRLMQEEGLKARVRQRFTCTTQSEPGQPVADNVLNRDFTAEAPNQRWVGDTTEFVIGESRKLYLAAILDLFSRFVVGWPPPFFTSIITSSTTAASPKRGPRWPACSASSGTRRWPRAPLRPGQDGRG